MPKKLLAIIVAGMLASAAVGFSGGFIYRGIIAKDSLQWSFNWSL